jgi:hypothetical protein
LTEEDDFQRAGFVAYQHIKPRAAALHRYGARVQHLGNDRFDRARLQFGDGAVRGEIIVAMGKMVEQIAHGTHAKTPERLRHDPGDARHILKR